MAERRSVPGASTEDPVIAWRVSTVLTRSVRSTLFFMQDDSPTSLLQRAAAFVRSYWTPAGKQAVGNLAGLLVCQAVGLGCQLVNLAVLTNSISPDDYGKYTLATSIFPYLYVLGTLAGGAIALRELRREPQQFGVIVSSHL